MLNYISAELYKLRFHKALYVGVVLLLLAESAVFLPFAWTQEQFGAQRELLLAFFDAAIGLGLLFVPCFAVLVFDDQYGHGTLKNEIVYGIPRSRVYVGKLCAGALAGTGVALLATVWYFFCTALKTGGPFEGSWEEAGVSLRVLVLMWLVWLSFYALTFFLLMLTKSTAGALCGAFLALFLVSPIAMGCWSGGGDLSVGVRLASELYFTTPMLCMFGGDNTLPKGSIVGWLGLSVNSYSILVCLLWMVGLSALGLAVLRRREIK